MMIPGNPFILGVTSHKKTVPTWVFAVHSCECWLFLVFRERELTFTFAICYRPSLCHLSVCLSVCLLSVTFVHPTHPVWNIRQFSLPFGTLAIRWHPRKILQRSSQGNPSVGGLNARRVAKYSDFWHLECCISETVQYRNQVRIKY